MTVVQLTCGFSYECPLEDDPPLEDPPEECIASEEEAVPALLAASEADARPIPDSSVWKVPM